MSHITASYGADLILILNCVASVTSVFGTSYSVQSTLALQTPHYNGIPPITYNVKLNPR